MLPAKEMPPPTKRRRSSREARKGEKSMRRLRTSDEGNEGGSGRSSSAKFVSTRGGVGSPDTANPGLAPASCGRPGSTGRSLSAG